MLIQRHAHSCSFKDELVQRYALTFKDVLVQRYLFIFIDNSKMTYSKHKRKLESLAEKMVTKKRKHQETDTSEVYITSLASLSFRDTYSGRAALQFSCLPFFQLTFGKLAVKICIGQSNKVKTLDKKKTKTKKKRILCVFVTHFFSYNTIELQWLEQ